MAKIGTLTADLALESATFIREMRKSAQASAKNTSAITKQLRNVENSFMRVGGAVKGMIAAYAGLRGAQEIKRLSLEAIEFGDNLAKTSKGIGIATDDLQRLHYAGDLAGVSYDNMDRMLAKLVKTVGEAKVGSGALYTILKKGNPVLLEQLKTTNSVTDAFALFLSAVEDANTVQEKAALGAAGFGRAWTQATRLLAGGSEAFQKNIQRADELGFVIGKDLFAQAEKVTDQMFEFQKASQAGFSAGVLESFSSGVELTDDELRDLVKTMREFGNFVGTAFQKAITGTIWFGRRLREIRDDFREVFKMDLQGDEVDFVLNPTDIKMVTGELEAQKDGVSELQEMLAAYAETNTGSMQAVQEKVKDTTKEIKTFNGEMTDFFETMGSNVEQGTSAVQGMFGSLKDTMSDFIMTGKVSFQDLMQSMGKAVADFVASKAVAALGGLLLNLATGGGAGIAGGLLGGGGGLLGGLLGFQHGGSFTVPGPPGPDKPVLLGLSGGEKVDVTRSSRSGQAQTVHVPGFDINQLYDGAALQLLAERLGYHLDNGGSLGRGREWSRGSRGR